MPWEAERSRGEVSGEAQALSHGCRVETGTAGSRGGGGQGGEDLLPRVSKGGSDRAGGAGGGVEK